MMNSNRCTLILNGGKWPEQEDHLIQHYFGIDYEILWDIIENKIHKLYQSIEEILKSNQ